MGYYGPTIEIRTTLSRHNSGRDIRDNLLHEQLVNEIRQVIAKPEYRLILADMTHHGIDWRDDDPDDDTERDGRYAAGRQG